MMMMRRSEEEGHMEMGVWGMISTVSGAYDGIYTR